MKESTGAAGRGAAGQGKPATGDGGKVSSAGGGMVANSAAKNKRGHSGMYHDIVSSLFNISSAAELEEIFLVAARDGDFAKIEALLKRRNEAIFSIDVRDKTTGNTAVIWAAKRGHVKILELLLRYGADITLRNYDDQTALEVASPQTRQLLLESADKGGPHRNLLQAAWQGNAKLVKKILTENTVDINVKNADGLTPLLLVTRDVQLFDKLGDRVLKGYDPIEVCQKLLSFRADTNAADEKGKTPLHYVAAAKAGKAGNLVDILLEEGCDIDAQDCRYFAPIHCASQSGNVEVLVALLDGGSDSNTRGFAGATPLHISALNGHDNVASKLLEYGADVTLVDDSGLTPVDVAKTKRVRNTLRQAWTEATQKKGANNLAPVRAPSEGAANRSPSPKRKKKGGEVIFDSLQTTSATSVESLTPRRSSTIYTLEKIISNQEKGRLAEVQMMKDIPESRSGISSRGAARTPVANTPRKLTPIRMASPRKKSVPAPQPAPRAGSGKHGYLKKCPSDPVKLYSQGRMQECQIPVTVLGFDLDDQLQEIKVKKVIHGPSGPGFPARKGHSRNHSDPVQTQAMMADGDDLSMYAQGRASKASVITIGEDYEDEELGSSPPSRLTPVVMRTPSASNRDRLNIPDTIQEGRVTAKPFIIDLDQMQLTNAGRSPVMGDGALYPNSHKLLPPTPTYMTEVSEEELQDSSDFSGGSKDSSPRSDNDISMEVPDLTRTKSILRAGNFDIQATRVRKSDDSGVQEDKTSSSKSSSVSSSVGNLSGEESQPVATPSGVVVHKTAGNTLKVPSTAVKVISPTSNSQTGSPIRTVNSSKVSHEQSAKLRAAASDNAAKKEAGKQTGAKTESVDSRGQAGASSEKRNSASRISVPRPAEPPPLPPKAAGTAPTGGGGTSRAQAIPKTGANKPPDGAGKDPPPLPPKPSNLGKNTRNSVDLSSSKQGDKTPSGGATKSKTSPRTALPVPNVNSNQASSGNRGGVQNTTSGAQSAPRIPQGIQGDKSSVGAAPIGNYENCTPQARTPAVTASTATTTTSNNNSRVTVVKNTTVVKVAAPGSGGVKKADSPAQGAGRPAGTAAHTATTAHRPAPATPAKPGHVVIRPAAAKSTDKQSPPPSKLPPPPLPPKSGASGSNLCISKEQTLSQVDSDAPVAPPRRKRSMPTSSSSDGSTGGSPALPRATQRTETNSSGGATKDKPKSPPAKAKTVVVKPLQIVSTPTTSAPIQQSSSIPTRSVTAGMKAAAPLASPSRSEMTPVTSTALNAPPVKPTSKSSAEPAAEAAMKVRQIAVRPATPEVAREADKGTGGNATKKGPVNNHSGPQITDAFESLRKEQEKQVRAIAGYARREVETGKSCNLKQPARNIPRSAVKAKNVGLNVPKEGAAATTTKKKVRQTSAGKKKTKTKNKVSSGPVQESEDAIVKTRPKSGKKVKKKGKGKSFKDKIVLLDKADMSNRTFISGIGWHIETECEGGKGDVHAVVMKFDESDSDEEESPRVRPNYLDDPENRSTASRAEKKSKRMTLPGQMHISDGSEVETEEEEEQEEDDDPEAEIVQDEVEFFNAPVPGDEDMAHSLRSIRDSGRNEYQRALMAEEMKLRATSPVQDPAHVIPQTVQAIHDFSRSVTKADPEHMLTAENGGKKADDTKPARVPSDTRDKKRDGETSDETPLGEAKPAARTVAGKGSPDPDKPEQAINNVRKVSPRTAKAADSPANKSASGVNAKEVKPKKSSTNGAKDDTKQAVKKAPSHAPKTKQREEAEINYIIEEILKTTPDPSLSLSWSTKKMKAGPSNATGMTKEDLAHSLRQSMEQGVFKELKRSREEEPADSRSVNCTLTRSVDSSLTELMSDMRMRDELHNANSDLEMLATKHRDLKLRVNAAMDGLVSPTGNVSARQPVVSKPPPAPKASGGGARNLDMEEMRPVDKSPRFVRKRHDDSLKGNNHGIKRDYAGLNDTGNMSDFGSMSLTTSVTADDSLVKMDRGQVVTSRLGRRGSMCSDITTDDVETIQWKRGNMLGKGAYGTVWCGLTNAGELIAVKQIELNIDNMDKAEEEYEKIQEEVELLKTLQHKNIVGYLGTSLEENYVVNIFMQFVPGGSIANLLARFGSLEEEVFCHYTQQILEGVEYLHSNDVIHRDIKGGNIMLMPTGVIKLIDFGCAKRICLNVSNGRSTSERHSRLLKSMRGTPFWMAPEVVNETGHGTKSDIWSVGCTIFEMATRKPPWADMAPMAAVFVIGSETKPIPQLPDKFSSNARGFVNACLTRNPSLRPSAPELLNHPFITKRRKKTGSFS